MPQAKEPRPPRTPKGHVAVRLDQPTIDRIDALLPLYELPGREPRRSDALRAVVHAGLAVEERRAHRRGRRRSPEAKGNEPSV
jgi:hypothetical protein